MEDRRDRLRELGELLRRLRKDAGLTGKDLAQRAGVAQPTISRMETGRLLPTPETVERARRLTSTRTGGVSWTRCCCGCVMRCPG
ncbi:helix-turn-helix domain-containing protein [Microtetraspora malaysiensis]|uniref:helix-turn-helix domain-containing protein n=1 Tax=Microtetraspora malaysiensis TaxID=161358 RepID=UPI000A6F5BFC